MSRLDIGDIFSREALYSLEKDQVLGFEHEGRKVYYKIVRIKPRQKKVIVEEIKLYKPEEVFVEPRGEAEEANT